MSPQEPDSPGGSGGDRWARIIFWALLLYALGLAVFVIEDAISHTYLFL
jgi:hypothetical protein